MTAKWKIAFGREAFKNFIKWLSPFKARNVWFGERDVAVPPFHRVSREDMLDQFVAGRLDLARFRQQFADVYSMLSGFYVDTSRWDSLAQV
jgi:hypothetical protein